MTEEEKWDKRRSKHMLKRILTYYYDDEGKLMNNRPFEEHFISDNPYYDNKSEVEKENAKLKKKAENLEKLLKQFLEAKNSEDTYKAEWQAEQFLKELDNEM